MRSVTEPEHRVSRDKLIASEVAEAVMRLSAAVHRYRSMVARGRYGVDTTGAIAVVALGIQGAMTPGEIATLTNLTPPATTELLDRLERLGYTERDRHPTDRRKILVSPTALAIEHVGAEVAEMARLLDPVLRATPDSNELSGTLSAITDGIEQANGRLARGSKER